MLYGHYTVYILVMYGDQISGNKHGSALKISFIVHLTNSYQDAHLRLMLLSRSYGVD